MSWFVESDSDGEIEVFIPKKISISSDEEESSIFIPRQLSESVEAVPIPIISRNVLVSKMEGSHFPLLKRKFKKSPSSNLFENPLLLLNAKISRARRSESGNLGIRKGKVGVQLLLTLNWLFLILLLPSCRSECESSS